MNLARPTPFVSTGELPPPERVRALVDEAHASLASIGEGRPSQIYPALAQVPPELFGICVVGARGGVYGVGDAEVEFTIMSVAKPFVFALVCARFGPEEMRSRVGANATGLPFNSLTAIEQDHGGRTNPMVNPGAIATTSLVPGATSDERWGFIVDGLSRFAGRELSLDDDVYRSASETNYVNRSIANLLESRGALSGDPAEAVDLYTRQSSLAVTARDLATMGATLALGGVNPLTGERVVQEETCRQVLAVMTTAGLYEHSGDWLYDVGLPGRAGSAVASSPSLPAKVGSPRLRPDSTRQETACADSLPHGFCRAPSGWTSSCHGPEPKSRHMMHPDRCRSSRRPLRRTRRAVEPLSP